MVKKRGGDRTLNPADDFRKSMRKKELKKNKDQRKRTREVIDMVKNPEKIVEEVRATARGAPPRTVAVTNATRTASASAGEATRRDGEGRQGRSGGAREESAGA